MHGIDYGTEDSTIRDRLKSEITKTDSAAKFERLVREYSSDASHIAGSLEDARLAQKILHFFESNSAVFEKPMLKNYSVQLSLPDETKPNYVSLVRNGSNEVVFSSFNNSKPYTGGYNLFSPAGNVTVNFTSPKVFQMF